MIRTANPALNDNVFRGVGSAVRGDVMTLDGTVNKSLLSIALLTISAWWTWTHPELGKFFIPSFIVTIVVLLVLMFKQSWAPVLTPVYALAEGVLLGMISLFAETMYPGIVFQAVSLTFGVFFALLFAYKSKMIPVTENFKLGIMAATGGIAIGYLIVWVANILGYQTNWFHGSGLLSIGISVFVVVIAALNLVLDFDFIENAAKRGDSPKYMEWYAAFGLLVTLVWLYIEILRLLMKLNSRE